MSRETSVLDYVREHELDLLCQTKADWTVFKESAHRGKQWRDQISEPSIPCNWPDLVRLHRLVISRKAVTVLEFGVGYSTLVLAQALFKNRLQHQEFVTNSLRKNNPFQLWSVDADEHFIRTTKHRLPNCLNDIVTFCASEVLMGNYQGKICTYYERLPNICPDLIYIDGPSRYHPANHLRNITTAHPDRMPMSADILAMEWFLCPGTLIVIDGRTANARFLKCNLQREWRHTYDPDEDYHTFELVEPPLGAINRKELEWRTVE